MVFRFFFLFQTKTASYEKTYSELVRDGSPMRKCIRLASFLHRGRQHHRQYAGLQLSDIIHRGKLCGIPGHNKQWLRLTIQRHENIAERSCRFGQMGIWQAACEYAFWFNSMFDAHYYVDAHLFWQVYKRKDTPDYKGLMKYEPQKLSTRIDKRSYLIRVPSCAGNNPTFEWMANAVNDFQNSKCKNLIIDIRGNMGAPTPFGLL